MLVMQNDTYNIVEINISDGIAHVVLIKDPEKYAYAPNGLKSQIVLPTKSATYWPWQRSGN